MENPIYEMNSITLNISYWTFPDGEDFENLDDFKKGLTSNYKTSITSQKTDACGGGLYELALEIILNINYADVIDGIIVDGIKIGLVLALKPIFDKIKNLFQKNQRYKPDIEVVKIVFKDIEIFIYPLYPKSIQENYKKIIETVSNNFFKIQGSLPRKVKSIHIPIFNKIDCYEICEYRVKLNVDENIPTFKKKDYYQLWGIRCSNKMDFIFEVRKQKLTNAKFYTQTEYDKLLDKKFEFLKK